MLGRLRHKLRMMRYYSAPRRETIWTRAEDWALVVALVLSLPAAWVADRVMTEPREAISVSGFLLGEREDQLRAWVKTDVRAEPGGTLCARWSLVVTDVYRGWPLTTTVERRPATFNLDVPSEPAPRKEVKLAMDDPMRLVIAQELQRQGFEETAEAWQQQESITQIEWWSWLAAWAGWWIGLTLVSWFGIGVIRIIALRVQRWRKMKEWELRSEGKCVACGYDLTGLDFKERCPECGTLMW